MSLIGAYVVGFLLASLLIPADDDAVILLLALVWPFTLVVTAIFRLYYLFHHN